MELEGGVKGHSGRPAPLYSNYQRPDCPLPIVTDFPHTAAAAARWSLKRTEQARPPLICEDLGIFNGPDIDVLPLNISEGNLKIMCLSRNERNVNG